MTRLRRPLGAGVGLAAGFGGAAATGLTSGVESGDAFFSSSGFYTGEATGDGDDVLTVVTGLAAPDLSDSDAWALSERAPGDYATIESELCKFLKPGLTGVLTFVVLLGTPNFTSCIYLNSGFFVLTLSSY